jgi:DNA (cytosine-5)-methyltransferase 1
VLNGFPESFPWSGSRSRQFLQAANVVAPQVAAALLSQVAL